MEKALESRGQTLSPNAIEFPDHLRYGVPTENGRVLATRGVRHRLAYVSLGRALDGDQYSALTVAGVLPAARDSLRSHELLWRQALGEIAYVNTVADLQQ